MTKEDTLSPTKYYPKHDMLHRKSPVAMITPHKVSSPHNSGSLNKYIEVFIHDVVDSTSRPHKEVTNKIIETISKTNLDHSESKGNSELNNSIINSMSHQMNYVLENAVKQHDKEDGSFYIEASDYNSIALNTAPIDSNIKMRAPFVSRTKRYPDIKQSPGPGSYDIAKEKSLDQSYIKVQPPAFGSNYK